MRKIKSESISHMRLESSSGLRRTMFPFTVDNSPRFSRCSLSWFLVCLLLFFSTILPLHGFLHHHHSDNEASGFKSAEHATVATGDSELCSLCLLLRTHQAALPLETVLAYSGTSILSAIDYAEALWTPQIPGKGRSPPLLIILSI
jgi:hypothetical protein